MEQQVQIVDWKPEYTVYFERLNKAWIERLFRLEAADRYVLENPEESILQKGGRILFASYQGKVIGTVALQYLEEGVFELIKMAVDPDFQGMGAGRLLCEAAIGEARKLKAHKVVLYSNRSLGPAIHIYRKLGFVEEDVEPGIYERANIKMVLYINQNAS